MDAAIINIFVPWYNLLELIKQWFLSKFSNSRC